MTAANSPPHPELHPNPAVSQNSCQKPNIQLFHLLTADINRHPNIRNKTTDELLPSKWAGTNTGNTHGWHHSAVVQKPF